MVSDKSGKAQDGTQTQAGQNLQSGSEQTSAIEQITSRIEPGKQYGGADVKKLVEDALSADGRAQKDRADRAESEVRRLTEEHDGLTTRFTTVSNQVAEILRAKDDAEADQVKDDPVALGSLRARQANRAESLRLEGIKAANDAREAKIIAREADVNKRLTTLSIRAVATEAGVDEAQLADLVPDGNPERLKKMAGILKQSGITSTKPGEKPAGLTNRPASAVSAGGAETGIRQIIEKAKNKGR